MNGLMRERRSEVETKEGLCGGGRLEERGWLARERDVSYWVIRPRHSSSRVLPSVIGSV